MGTSQAAELRLHPTLPSLLPHPSFSSRFPPLWPLGQGSGARSPDLWLLPWTWTSFPVLLLQEPVCLGQERHLVGSESV